MSQLRPASRARVGTGISCISTRDPETLCFDASRRNGLPKHRAVVLPSPSDGLSPLAGDPCEGMPRATASSLRRGGGACTPAAFPRNLEIWPERPRFVLIIASRLVFATCRGFFPACAPLAHLLRTSRAPLAPINLACLPGFGSLVPCIIPISTTYQPQSRRVKRETDPSC